MKESVDIDKIIKDHLKNKQGDSQPPADPPQQPSQPSDPAKKADDNSGGAFCGGAICMCILMVVLAYFFGQQ